MVPNGRASYLVSCRWPPAPLAVGSQHSPPRVLVLAGPAGYAPMSVSLALEARGLAVSYTGPGGLAEAQPPLSREHYDAVLLPRHTQYASYVPERCGRLWRSRES